MKRPRTGEEQAYRRITGTLRRLFRQDRGATAADITAATALPLSTVRELLPRAADEYSGRLQVTESGEILYSFPRGFRSRYRGFRAVLSRCREKAAVCLLAVFSLVFKIWIMMMLVGYFALFMLIALASLALSVVAAGSSNSGGRSGRNGGGRSGRNGGFFFAESIFHLVIRLWFYSELTSAHGGGTSRRGTSRPGSSRPLHKCIFSFVFGEEDPNRGWASREKKAIIAYLQSHSGIMALPEFMALTGLSPDRAEEEILAFSGEFGGMPEASPGGTVIYRFDEILKGSVNAGKDSNAARPGTCGAEITAPVKRLRIFSSNKKNVNTWFVLINGINLLFGSYFLYNAATTGPILTPAGFEESSYVYALVTRFLLRVTADPRSVIAIGLGIVPLVFSILFWLIPAFRLAALRRENGAIKLENFRKRAFSLIWEKPAGFRETDITERAEECSPENRSAACDRVIKDMGAYSMPDVEIADKGGTVYNFTALETEREILEKCRAGVKDRGLGKTVFDSDL
ncbi:MAG: hypothetical protein LBG42_08190 [Treponema sp.]|jgi:hypothetical protein|nr:hypothetical protein [Treponema sp.]